MNYSDRQQEIYNAQVMLSVRTLLEYLCPCVGQDTVALACIVSVRSVHRWFTGVWKPRGHSERTLRCLYGIMRFAGGDMVTWNPALRRHGCTLAVLHWVAKFHFWHCSRDTLRRCNVQLGTSETTLSTTRSQHRQTSIFQLKQRGDKQDAFAETLHHSTLHAVAT